MSLSCLEFHSAGSLGSSPSPILQIWKCSKPSHHHLLCRSRYPVSLLGVLFKTTAKMFVSLLKTFWRLPISPTGKFRLCSDLQGPQVCSNQLCFPPRSRHPTPCLERPSVGSRTRTHFLRDATFYLLDFSSVSLLHVSTTNKIHRLIIFLSASLKHIPRE